MSSAATAPLARGQRGPSEPRPTARHDGHRDMSHGGARRPCRALRRLRPYAHRLQLLPQSPLPEVPMARGGAMAGGARGRAPAGALFPRGVHAAGRGRRDRLSEQGGGLWTSVQGRRRADATTIAADPKHLGAEIGLTAVLHTWGQKTSIIILMSTASFRAAASPPTANAGYPAGRASFCRCACSRVCFGGCSSKASWQHSKLVSCNSSPIRRDWRSGCVQGASRSPAQDRMGGLRQASVRRPVGGEFAITRRLASANQSRSGAGPARLPGLSVCARITNSPWTRLFSARTPRSSYYFHRKEPLDHHCDMCDGPACIGSLFSAA